MSVDTFSLSFGKRGAVFRDVIERGLVELDMICAWCRANDCGAFPGLRITREGDHVRMVVAPVMTAWRTAAGIVLAPMPQEGDSEFPFFEGDSPCLQLIERESNLAFRLGLSANRSPEERPLGAWAQEETP